MYAARMPLARHCQVVPPSRVIHTPPHETPTVTWRASRGSTQLDWRPGSSAPVREHDRGVVGEEVRAGDRPARARPSLAALDRENTLAGSDEEPVAHPPESACITQTSPSVGTASLRCARSRICRPLTNTTM